ncbi:LamG-like jellyroll fold domain-containing protein [Pendulispora albinea]|uniref:Metallophosphoesterase n=1 Tax=Pendulispora albinea TaxID=2741071 RepID=A0ABZ2LWU5_9BACT
MPHDRFGRLVLARLSVPACSLSLLACSADTGERDVNGAPPSGSEGAATDISNTNDVAEESARARESVACPAGKVKVDATSLALDGEDGYVTMGEAAGLALERFTLEAWVRRDGFGVPFANGEGAPSLVPIASKGRDAADGSSGGGNYALGFAGDVLAADFEDATGAHHPIAGKTEIPLGQWHHLAASYDGAAWRLFVDGQLDAASTQNATPRTDGVQPFAVGSSLDARGVPAGFLKGRVDEVRIWNRALGEGEVADAMYRRVGRGAGLAGRWAFDKKDRGAPDSVGSSHGTMAGGAALAGGGAILDVGRPPALRGESSSALRTVAGRNTTLHVNVDDPDSAEFTASFHVRQVSGGEDFTIVVLPDTQYYSRYPEWSKYYYDQTKWIMNNAKAYNIVGVIHNGDIVDQVHVEAQWKVADQAMKTLEASSTSFPHGMPYGTGAGNHDQDPFGTPGGTAKYNQYFGPARFRGRPYFGGTYAANEADENWVTFSAGGLDIVLVDLQYSATARPAAVLNWTKGIFNQHPDAFGIVNSHHILNADAAFSAAGKSIYDAVKTVPNVQLLTCGHISAENKRSDVFNGRTIHSMLADYQSRANGGGGYLRIWEFSPRNNELTVRSYSPTENKFETDANSQFTLKVDLSGAGNAAFKTLATADPADASHVEAALEGLAPGQTYEWYATVTDCAHTVTSPVYRFKTK